MKTNWILKMINESINENGYLTENILRLVRTQLRYRDEYIDMVKVLEEDSLILAYLMLKENDGDSETVELMKSKKRIQNYEFMKETINTVDEVEHEISCHEWCHHIMLPDSIGTYRCVRCGVRQDEDFYCSNYVLLSNSSYEEGLQLYQSAINNLGENPSVIDIINEMLNIKLNKKSKVKTLTK